MLPRYVTPRDTILFQIFYQYSTYVPSRIPTRQYIVWTIGRCRVCHASWRRVCSRVHSPTRGNRSVAQQHEIMNDRPVRNVLIIVAMEQETMPLVKRFDLKRCPDKTFLPGAPFVGWSGNVGDIVLRVVWCGRDPRFGGVNNVATTAAAVATYASIAAFGTPELLVSAGTGGFNAAGAAVELLHERKVHLPCTPDPVRRGARARGIRVWTLSSPPQGLSQRALGSRLASYRRRILWTAATSIWS